MITPIEIVQHHLSSHFPGVSVVGKVPRARPEVFIRVDMGAPQRINLAQYRTLIIVQVYGSDLEQVLGTIFTAGQTLETIDAAHPLVSGWDEETGPVEFPDPDIPQHRWQMTGQLFHTLG